jgi:hypothetical protein
MSPYVACGEHAINSVVGLASMERGQLINMSPDTTLKLKFYDLRLDSFWFYVRNEYPVIANKALDMLLPSATSYSCDTAFSTLKAMKTKSTSKLRDIEI